MKYCNLIFSLATAVLTFASATYASDCGTLVRHTGDTKGNFSRDIDQYQKADGSTYYVYHLSYFGVPSSTPNYTEFNVHVKLNNKEADFIEVVHPSELAGEMLSDNCGNDWGIQTVNADLFTYARNGDHLNAWDLSATINGKTETVRFEQVSFSQLFAPAVNP